MSMVPSDLTGAYLTCPLILPNTPLGGNNKKKDGMDVELAQI